MSNKKQTAVEWLENKFYRVALSEVPSLFEQAKEMEKEQIIEACYFAYNEGCSYMTDGKTEYESFEQYYTETYEK